MTEVHPISHTGDQKEGNLTVIFVEFPQKKGYITDNFDRPQDFPRAQATFHRIYRIFSLAIYMYIFFSSFFLGFNIFFFFQCSYYLKKTFFTNFFITIFLFSFEEENNGRNRPLENICMQRHNKNTQQTNIKTYSTCVSLERTYDSTRLIQKDFKLYQNIW